MEYADVRLPTSHDPIIRAMDFTYGAKMAVPEFAHARWISGGVAYSARIPVRSRVGTPEAFAGTVDFYFSDDSLAVIAYDCPTTGPRLIYLSGKGKLLPFSAAKTNAAGGMAMSRVELLEGSCGNR